MPAITASHLVLSDPPQDLCCRDITQNKLFQLAGSPDDSVQLFDILSGLVGKTIPGDREGITLRVLVNNSNGVDCFHLSRYGSGESNGIVAILVFNDKKEITRW